MERAVDTRCTVPLRQDAPMHALVVRLSVGPLVLALSACSIGTGPREAAAPRGSDDPVASEAGEELAACEPVRLIPEQVGSHLIGGASPPVAYNSTPPTSGWHSSGAFTIDVQPRNDPLSEPEHVSVLEAGGAVISYRAVGNSAAARIARLVRRSYAGQVAVTPYKKLRRGEVALTSWGVLQRCDGMHLPAIRRFLNKRVVDEVDQPGH